VQALKSVLQKGVSLLVFPEGTFNETGKPLKDFYDGAFRIAIETGAPIRPVLMLDTYDRMHYSSVFSFNPGRSRSVFLEEVQTAGLSWDDLDALREKVYGIMEDKLRQYGATWIKA
jgi:1-acyl-sn-glycerol-3-phosphate acyltransferase